ncbi:hypothetical protein JXA47_13090 [Candidatus Sumerlaeota bacterium]|nr:hypothetical protein [Candidatus Sumerlaeota bacterium]
MSYLSWGSGSGTWNSTMGWMSVGDLWGSSAPGDWAVFSRDVAQDMSDVLGLTLTDIDSFYVHTGDQRVDDIRLADARTTRVFTLAPSALGEPPMAPPLTPRTHRSTMPRFSSGKGSMRPCGL